MNNNSNKRMSHFIKIKDQVNKLGSINNFLNPEYLLSEFSLKETSTLDYCIQNHKTIAEIKNNTIFINKILINEDYSHNFLKFVCVYFFLLYKKDFKITNLTNLIKNLSDNLDVDFIDIYLNFNNVLNLFIPINLIKPEWNYFCSIFDKQNQSGLIEKAEKCNLLLNYLSYKLGYNKNLIYKRFKRLFPTDFVITKGIK